MHTFAVVLNALLALKDIISPLGLAVIMGVSIGAERTIRGRPAGLRTYLLVCVSFTVIAILSESHYVLSTGTGYRPDPARLAAGGLTGIGFLGAGVIIHSRFSVFGLTTAAGLWTVAVIGLTLGSKDYTLAFTLYSMTLGSLWLLRYLETLLPRETFRQLSLHMHNTNFTLAEAEHFFRQYRLVLERASIDTNKQQQTVHYTFFVHGKKTAAFMNAFAALLAREDVHQGQLLQLDAEEERT